MKRTITRLLCASFFLVTTWCNAQVFTETMGSAATSTTLISAYETANSFDNDNFTMSGTGDMRNTTASNVYASASAGSNVFLTNNASKTFLISGINTSGLSNVVVSFGVSKSTTASNGSDLLLEYSTDGLIYTAISYPLLPTGTGTAVWALRSSTTALPQGANLTLRWTNNSSTAQYRLDDISISGAVSCTPPTVSISSSVPNATLCASGGDAATALTANLSGGVGSWNYQWKYWNGSSFTSINGGTNATQNASPTNTLDYQVIVTSTANAQCTASAVQTVTVVADPVLSVSSSNVLCYGDNNGTAAGSLTGGTAGNTYTLNWSPGTPAGDGTLNISGLAPGTYTLTANGLNGCNVSGSVTITEPTVLTSASTSGTITCNGGTTTVTVSANGGTAPYSGTGSFTVGAGTYSYTVTDANGCTSTTSITVTQPTPLVATITSNAPNTTVCNGGTAVLSASISGGLGNINYQWQFQDNNGNWVNVSGTGWSGSNVATPFTSGGRNASPSVTRAYRIVVTSSQNSQCTVTATQLVTVIPDPVFTLTSTNVTCNSLNNGTATAVLTGGLALNYGYNWFSDDGNSSNNNPSGDGTLSVTGLFPAEWVINTTVSGSNFGCYAQSSVFITQPAVLESSSTSGSIACNGGSTTVTVSATGGTAPYSGTGTFTVTAGTYSYTVTDANGCTSTTSITVSEPTVLTSASTSGSIACNGGTTTVSVSANGGTAPYSGTGTFTVSAGTYSYTVTDANGCTSTTSITVTEPTALGASNVASDFNGYGVSCNGGSNGSVNVSATGGTTPYSGDGAYTNLSAGNYSYTVTDANGCTASTSATITEPTVLTSASTSGSIACNGGTTTVSVSAAGGTAPYSGDGDYTVGAGTYSYTVTDANGCTSTTSITVTEPTALETTVGPGQTVFYGYAPMACATISGSATGGTPGYTYSWSSNGTTNGTSTSLTVCPTLSTTYTLTVTDILGCTSSADVNICVVDVRCYAGNSNKQKVQMCQIPQGNPANAHTICVDASAVPAHLAIGCVLGACNEQETVCPSSNALRSVDIEEEKLSSALSVYPNPTSDRTTVSLTVTNAGEYKVVLYNTMGQVVNNIYTGSIVEFENQTFDLNMTDLEFGVYILSVSNLDGTIETVRVVKQ